MDTITYLPVQGKNGVTMILLANGVPMKREDNAPNLPGMFRHSKGNLAIFEELSEWMSPRDVEFLHRVMARTDIPMDEKVEDKTKAWTPDAFKATFMETEQKATEDDILNNAL